MSDGYLLDLHCHTAELSYDGQVSASVILPRLRDLGFAGVVFTDHNNVWTPEQLGELRTACDLPDEFVLLSAQEVRTVSPEGITVGDLLVYGPTDSIPDGTSPRDAMDAARAAGGFCTAAHAGVPRIGFGEALADYPGILGAEVWNGRYGQRAAERAEAIALACGLPCLGGSDTHRPDDIGGGGTVFPELPRTFADLARLITAGQCEPWRPRSTSRLWRWLRRSS